MDPAEPRPLPRRAPQRSLAASVPVAGPAPASPRRGVDPSVHVEGRPLLTAEGHLRHPERYVHDPRGVAYPHRGQNPATYYTTQQLADVLLINPTLVYSWCRESWFGLLPKNSGRGRPKAGFRIPREYLYIARLYLQTQDTTLRDKGRVALLTQLRDYVIVCGDLYSTHYTPTEVVMRLESMYSNSSLARCKTTIVCVGPILPEDVHLTR